MARIAHRNADETRERILDAATLAFSRDGYAAVSTRAVAGAAQVNVATLSYHFGNKQGLYDAVVERVYARIRSAAAELVPDLSRGTMHDKVGAIVDFSRRERAAVRLLVREVLDHGRLTPTTERAHFLPNVAENSALLAAFLDVPVQQARRALVTGGFLLSRFAIQDDDSLREALGLPPDASVRDTIVEILLHTTTHLVSH